MGLARRERWGSIVAAVGLLFICAATLIPGSASTSAGAGVVCRGWCDDNLMADFARNIMLFLPFAFGLRISGWATWRVVICGSLLSAIVELLQIRIVVGRDASTIDWISNTAGTALGALIATHARRLIRPDQRNALRLGAAGLIVWLMAVILGAWGIQPAPGSHGYWGQRTPHFSDFAAFRGELISARVDGVELPSGRIGDAAGLDAALTAGSLHVDASVLAGEPYRTGPIEPIARIADGTGREILVLGRAGDELVFRYRMRATALRLQTPGYSLERAFRAGNSDAASTAIETIAASLSRETVTIAARDRRGSRIRTFDLNPAVAWTFFLPWEYWLGPNALWLSALWLGGLLLPAAFWTARTTRDLRKLAVPVFVVVVLGTLVLLPRFFRIAPAAPWEFAAVAIGALVGWTLAAVPRGSRSESEELRPSRTPTPRE